MGHLFKPDTVIGFHLCIRMACEISSLLNIQWSTVSGIITKWMHLGTTATSAIKRNTT